MENMTQQNRKYFDEITIARGIGILLVVLGHALKQTGVTNTAVDVLIEVIYSFHMPLFMMVSGYLYSKSNHKNKSYEIKKRLLSYGVPYIVFSVLWILMKLVLSSMTNSSVFIIDIPRAAFYPVSFMWFIYALLIMQIVQIFLGDMSRGRKAIHLLIGGGGTAYSPY